MKRFGNLVLDPDMVQAVAPLKPSGLYWHLNDRAANLSDARYVVLFLNGSSIEARPEDAELLIQHLDPSWIEVRLSYADNDALRASADAAREGRGWSDSRGYVIVSNSPSKLWEWVEHPDDASFFIPGSYAVPRKGLPIQVAVITPSGAKGWAETRVRS